MAQSPTYNEHWGLYPSVAVLNAATLGNPALSAGDTAVVIATDYQYDGTAWVVVTAEVANAPVLGPAVNTQTSNGSAMLSSETSTGDASVRLAHTGSGFAAELSATALRPRLSTSQSGSPAPLELDIAELVIGGTAGAAGEMLTSNGPGLAPTWQAPFGTIAGTIGANEIAFGTAPDTIGGAAGFTYTGGTVAINGGGMYSLEAWGQVGIRDIASGEEVIEFEPSLFSFNVRTDTTLDPGPGYITTVAAGQVAIVQNTDSTGASTMAGANLDPAKLTLSEIVPGTQTPTIQTADALGAPMALDVVVGELRVNGDAGTSGQVLTSNGTGAAPTWQAGGGGGGSTAMTDDYYVDAVLGSDVTGDGSISKPYKTIQACLTAIGNPTSKQDACRKITVNIGQARSSGPGLIASQANDFNGIYEENLWVPSRMITFVGPGTKIGNNADNSGFGNITQEISTARRFGATSSEVRHTMSFIGRANSRDTHQRVRNGIHVGGITRVSCIARNIAAIQGDSVGGTRVTITLAGGQNPYGVPVSPYASLNVTLTDAGDVVGYTSPTGVAIANSTSANQMVFFRSIVGTTGPVVDTYYYVVNATLTTFQLSNSIGGPAIALTGNGTGVIMAKPGYPPFEDLARIKVAGTVNYGTTASTIAYDIIEKLTDTSFIAKRVTGTNTSAALEVTGSFAETDSTGSSTLLTHDMFFDCCYQQGLVVHDDGAVYSGAPAIGANGALYARDSRFNSGFIASGVTVQRWENSQAVTTVNTGATVASYSRTTNVVTVTTSTTCQWATGQVVTITNSTSGGGQTIDGTWTILAGGTNTFTLSQTGADYGAQTPTVSASITGLSSWGTIVTMNQATFTGVGIQLGSTPFTLSTDDQGVANTRFGITRLYTSTTSAMPLARFDAYTSSWIYASNAFLSFPVTFTDAGDTVTRTAHGLSNGAVVRFSGIVNTTGIAINTDYYVVNVAASTFQLALTPGGAAIALTTNGTGTMDVLPLYYPAFLDTYVPTQLYTGNQWVQTSSVTAANTTTETNLTGAGVGMLNLPANFLKLGRNLRLTGSGYFSCTAAAPTLRIQVKLGAVVIADTTALALPAVAESNKLFTFDVLCSVRATGAAGSIFSNGTMTRLATALAAVPLNVLSAGVPAAVTVNTTTSQLLTVTATWGTADPSNTITLTNLVLTA